MGDKIKNQLILLLAALTLVFLIMAVGSCNNLGRLKGDRDKEMASRIDLEEKINKFSQDKARQEEELKKTKEGLEAELAGHQATKKALAQEQLVNQSLKEELAKAIKLKETLEGELKAASTPGKSDKGRQ
ncbi:MAG: hypothetical protein PHG40_01595 [Candidatus Omnitrophica bacterium]|nr:hypothetical protein [Candidatus Omnitrophota bacterium]